MIQEEIIQGLKEGKIKLHEIEKYTSIEEAVEIRRLFIERITGKKLEHISKYSIDMEEAQKKNIENPIGAIQIPLGVAGPIKIRGEHAKGKFYIPLATSEGALVASVTGMLSIQEAGRQVRKQDKMTRAPYSEQSQ